MTTPLPAIDDLDRLAFRLRRLIREQHPQLATHGFTLRDLEEHLLPFREARREMADGSPDSWERVMLRLLAGERDVIAADAAMQRACRDALASAAPTLSLVRGWSTHRLQLGLATGDRPQTPRDAPSTPTRPCRYCGCGLPDGIAVTFCPHCGLDLSKQQCPACSTALEVTWRFCVTCGRATDIDAERSDG